jgi:hypothetical protein
VAIGAAAALLAALLLAGWGLHPRFDGRGVDQTALDIGVLVLAGGGLLFVGFAVGGGAGGTRPLGLVWDLLCFLPRAGHPLAPPCYAERAVPELIARCNKWTLTTGTTVVLSAHSLGSVLAVGVIASPGLLDVSRVSLVSYGSQLRAYFSRIFPELLGPAVLGVPPSYGSQLREPDPWAAEKLAPRTDPAAAEGSVRKRLTGDGTLRWISLWRRTDYLGFPVWGFHPNPIDRRAEELLREDYLVEVQTHSGYPETGAYQRAWERIRPAGTPAAGNRHPDPRRPEDPRQGS